MGDALNALRPQRLRTKAASSLLPHWLDGYSECNSCSSRVLLAHVESANCPVAYQGLKITTSLSYVSMIFSGVRLIYLSPMPHNCKTFGGFDSKAIGESLFLRKLVLGIPAQASSKNLTRPLMPPAAPIRPRHLVPTQQGVGT
ncbi:hypothetical protein BJAS_P1635 [Bathymodiolus japonicus methanotrophic gill symbiont]|uniref:hypothetical protein n=1 Tax=Bathymodiolus japonicus methanotrophic gill symbiont TaxID=113269 RepID=UPI001B3D3A80|nr:hypothetical protein [Bathymodiolus japonicus methanotrophic gill symbiont]GFO71857.1 hypothetical protein BJAS_P1635 [Bathymodiolus japonicus methanotrophic gill symbiont]